MNVDALVTIGAVNVLLWAMIAYETFFVYDERRYLGCATESRSTSQEAASTCDEGGLLG